MGRALLWLLAGVVSLAVIVIAIAPEVLLADALATSELAGVVLAAGLPGLMLLAVVAVARRRTHDRAQPSHDPASDPPVPAPTGGGTDPPAGHLAPRLARQEQRMDRTARAALVAALIGFVSVAGLGVFLGFDPVGSVVAGAVVAVLVGLLLLGASRRAESFHPTNGRADGPHD